MAIDGLRRALVADREENPERMNATLERVLEVVENALGPGSALARDMETAIGGQDPRACLTVDQANTVAAAIEGSDLPGQHLEEIVSQLEYSEISTAEAIEMHERYKIPVSRLELDIVPVKGDGCWIVDTKGVRYLDMDSNYSATNLGMANPEIALGLFNQANLLISMKEDRVQIARTRFLREISGMMPPGLDRFYWQNSGGEAVDKSIKIAKAYTGTTDVVAFEGGFHGRTHGAVAVTYNPKYREPFGLDDVEWAHFSRFNDIDDARRVMDDTGAKIVILEMVQGEEAGNRPADPEFIRELWSLARERDAVIIDDEVQAGFGRTALKQGDWFGCMAYGVTPDIMVIGKSFGGGYPVTAVVTTRDVADAMVPGFDGSTFGGNPMAMTSALIATRQMRELDVTGNVVERSAQFESGLRELAVRHPVLGEIRVHGLMIAFSLGSPENVTRCQDTLRENRVKTSLSTGEFLRLLPPTVISEEEVDFFLKSLDSALGGL